jgi:pentatricopeptide repeat protein
MFSRTLIQTFENGYLMLLVCAGGARAAWKVFERMKRQGRVPFYRYA